MSIANGQKANATNFNNAFLSRTVNTSTIGKVDLQNEDSDDVLDLQSVINALLADVAAAGRRYVGNVVFNGVETSKDVDVSATIGDARDAVWQISNNANDYEILGVSIKKISATTVRITSNPPLAVGSYRLTGVQ